MESAVQKTPQRSSLIKRLIILFSAIYLSVTILGGIALGWIAMHPFVHAFTPSEEHNAKAEAQEHGVEFRDVAIQVPDGAVLRAWFMSPPEPNGNAVILLHGISDNRVGMYGYGKWLVQNHYMILLPDARAHGISTGALATYGLKESDDVHRWIDWIEVNYHPRCVFGIGESMGAAQLLQALPREPRFCAVVAESPFASFREVAYARLGQRFDTGPWLGRTLLRPAVEAGILFVRLHYRLNLENAAPENAVVGSKIPVLLIHGLDDTNIPPYHSDLIQAKNPADVAVWKVPNAFHTGAHKASPEEFDRRVLDWFAQHSSPSS